MLGSLFSGNFDEMYCKYWKNKLKESSKYGNNFSGNEKKNIMGQPESFLFKKDEEKYLFDKINEIRQHFTSTKKFSLCHYY